MYRIQSKENTVKIPPDKLGVDMEKTIEEITRSSFEGEVFPDHSLTILVTNIKKIGVGTIPHGDGAVYQRVKYDALVFRPELQEVVQGTICEILKFGAFVRFGPMDGLLHISQVMDDRIDSDLSNEKLMGKTNKRELKAGDRVKARIVAISVNDRNPRESKIGLTMRQPGLGKFDWIDEDRGVGGGAKKDKKAAKKKDPKDSKPASDDVKKAVKAEKGG